MQQIIVNLYVDFVRNVLHSKFVDIQDKLIDYNQYLDIEDYELEYEVNNEFEQLAFARYLDLLKQFSIQNNKAKAKFHRFVITKFDLD